MEMELMIAKIIAPKMQMLIRRIVMGMGRRLEEMFVMIVLMMVEILMAMVLLLVKIIAPMFLILDRMMKIMMVLEMNVIQVSVEMVFLKREKSVMVKIFVPKIVRLNNKVILAIILMQSLIGQ